MRPEILFPLFAEIDTLAGIGPRLKPLVARLIGGEHVADLLWHLPSGIIDRRFSPDLSDTIDGSVVTLDVWVERHDPSPNRRRPYRVICKTQSGTLVLAFFNARAKYLNDVLPVGEKRIVSGKIDHYRGEYQITHPDRIGTEAERSEIQTVEPVYPMSAGVTGKTLTKAVRGALETLPDFPEWHDPALVARHKWPDLKTALYTVHNPQDETDLSPDHPARKRLAYDELLANQLALTLIRAKMRKLGGRVTKGDGRLREALGKHLPFAMTGAQQRALGDIYEDMASEGRMLRLLQGDVGSGKTVVALMAMLNAVECGRQAALMAPTEILARQHFETISPLLEQIGIKCAILTGRDKGKARKTALEGFANGDVQIAVGTHALFQDDVAFHDLAFAVVDEQHRFGVHQRLMLAGKGQAVDVLVMTATPIPRTLTLTAFGDMEVSRLDEKPPGRKPVDTRVLPIDKVDDVISGIGRAMRSGTKIYWVCPLVEDSEVLDLQAAEERYRVLVELFGAERVGLVHGKMKGKEKDEVMEKFAHGDTSILVATTVIEVGVNVPEATIMVIEHSERFGLAQLHQLRGRIGRGDAASTCLLLYGSPLGQVSKARLKIMRETEDGFVIAEEDLKLRGAGEVLGTRQSGLQEYRLANLELHGDLLAIARDDARLIVERDPDLQKARGDALRLLLYLFERDEAVRYFRSG
ncbi:ATP-dependent DNA helicase RecG [Thalassospira sp.]|uniref:ATP-dependent DNA helicase RecG n=1 Tax=Thalassospira sp. TaxID=1912094 RepID=UPI000C5A9667|nr:ATP-dependent DNA helicase RecG [Thalassospira sp.]MBC08062.1 ATP-dependent DNA helicase RecG [Thalassospira sp.]|tara:strand:- start:2740 stop:4827 length:2088 start_codon:yes stop_codon:yes gene_type:complete